MIANRVIFVGGERGIFLIHGSTLPSRFPGRDGKFQITFLILDYTTNYHPDDTMARTKGKDNIIDHKFNNGPKS